MAGVRSNPGVDINALSISGLGCMYQQIKVQLAVAFYEMVNTQCSLNILAKNLINRNRLGKYGSVYIVLVLLSARGGILLNKQISI